MKKGILLLLAFIATLIPSSCEDSTLFVDCDKCYESISEKISLELKVTIDSENSFVPITLYRGDIDNGEVISEDTAYTANFYTQDVAVGEYYSAIARYSHNGRIINAVDGRKLRKKLDKNSCNNPCYIVQGDLLDLRLK